MMYAVQIHRSHSRGDKASRTCRPVRQWRQRGVTVIDFMIGLTIGLLVVLAAVGSLIMTRSSAHTINDSAGLEQQASLIMQLIGQQISQAGATNTCVGIFCNGTDPNNDGIFFDSRSVSVPNSPNTSASIYGRQDTTVQDGAGNNPDILTISYAAPTDGSPTAINCIGNNPVQGSTTIPGFSQPSLVVSQFSLNKNKDLVCGTGVSSSQPIASHLADMQITYLVADANGSITYQKAGDITSSDWANVKGVQVCLEMQGDPTQAPPPNNALTDCLNKKITENDGRVYRVVKQIFYLRNTN